MQINQETYKYKCSCGKKYKTLVTADTHIWKADHGVLLKWNGNLRMKDLQEHILSKLEV